MSVTTSLLKIAASRANGKLSKGPKTDAGKHISSLNAVSHGFTAKHAFLRGEDPQQYRIHHEMYCQHYGPINDFNREMVAEIADLNWRLRRVPAFEALVLAEEIRALATEPNPQFTTKAQFVAGALIRYPQTNGRALLRRYTTKFNRRIDELHTRLEGARHLAQLRAIQKIAA